MSLYRHVSKEDLLNLMTDTAWGDSPEPLADGENWRSGCPGGRGRCAPAPAPPWAVRIPINSLPILPHAVAWFGTPWPAWPVPA